MKKYKVIGVSGDEILFDNNARLFSSHNQDCCESHELTLDDISVDDFDGLEFNLNSNDFFKGIPDFGIELVPLKGHSVKIPAHGYNNGYYSDELILTVVTGDVSRDFDISEYQDISS